MEGFHPSLLTGKSWLRTISPAVVMVQTFEVVIDGINAFFLFLQVKSFPPISPQESGIDNRMVPSTEWWVGSCKISILRGRTTTLSQQFPSTVGSRLPN